MYMNPEQQEHLAGLDKDSESRYDVQRVWYPDRVHKIDNREGPVDFLGDESFYAPSKLGSAEVFPKSVTVGQVSPLTLTWRCGGRGMQAGDRLCFFMRGQAPLGCYYQQNDPAKPGWFEVSGPEGCVLRPVVLGFEVESGELREGDGVTVRVSPFAFTPIAGRYEFKAVFRFAGGGCEQRLHAPVVVEVLPDNPYRLEVTRPCTVRRGEESRVHVTVRDRYDNRVPHSGVVYLTQGDEERMIPMVSGMADGCMPDGAAPVEARLPELLLEGEANPSRESEEYQLYVGDLHVHDFLSEAHQYSDRVYDWAIEDRNLDFVSVSVQTHGWIDNQKWTIEKYHCERYLREGRFVTLLANEWQHTEFGDKIIHHLGGDQPFLCVDDPRYNTPAKLYDTVRGLDAVIISHHTAYPLGSWCAGTNFPCVDTSVERLAELWSMHGSSEGFVEGDRPLKGMDPANSVMAALRSGLRLGFVAGSDTHSGRPGGGPKEPMAYWGGLACVWARELTRAGIMEALKARRTYAITGERIVLRMTVNGAEMGSELPAAEKAAIRISVSAPSEIAKVQIVKNTALLKEFAMNSETADIDFEDAAGGAAFYHCRVVLSDGNLAVCSPVWIG